MRRSFPRPNAGKFLAIATLLICPLLPDANSQVRADEPESPAKYTLLVMDPLSAPLACDCVQGYAQRKYERLGAYLQQKLNKPVQVVWSESMKSATKEHGAAHIIVGKHSVVQSQGKKLKQKVRPLAQLTGLDGKVTQTGLFVVRAQDSAKSMSELKGYRIFFGPKDCSEKHAAPMQLLKDSNVELPAKIETAGACSQAAADLMELDASVNAAAVISSYAKPLLSGCGTIKKGDLRVIGESKAVPFITAFASSTLPKGDIKAIRTALLDVELDAQLVIALESSEGFKRWQNPDKKSAGKKGQSKETTAAATLETAAKKK